MYNTRQIKSNLTGLQVFSKSFKKAVTFDLPSFQHPFISRARNGLNQQKAQMDWNATSYEKSVMETILQTGYDFCSTLTVHV